MRIIQRIGHFSLGCGCNELEPHFGRTGKPCLFPFPFSLFPFPFSLFSFPFSLFPFPFSLFPFPFSLFPFPIHKRLKGKHTSIRDSHRVLLRQNQTYDNEAPLLYPHRYCRLRRIRTVVDFSNRFFAI